MLSKDLKNVVYILLQQMLLNKVNNKIVKNKNIEDKNVEFNTDSNSYIGEDNSNLLTSG